jgi:hypothetical protein
MLFFDFTFLQIFTIDFISKDRTFVKLIVISELLFRSVKLLSWVFWTIINGIKFLIREFFLLLSGLYLLAYDDIIE